VENIKVVNEMELLKQSSLAAIFAGECSKTVNKMDIIHISSRVEARRLANSKMERWVGMGYSNGLMEQHITGSGIRMKEKDTEFLSIPTMMSAMDNGKITTDQVK
jgi:hypothetical protein